MSEWSHMVELREESSGLRAYRTDTGKEIPIPTFPGGFVSIEEWLQHMPLDSLEAARQAYMDTWTWDNDDLKYLDVAVLITSEIRWRVHRMSAQIQDPAKMGRTTLDLTGTCLNTR